MSEIKKKHTRMALNYADEVAVEYPFDPYDFSMSTEKDWYEMMENAPELEPVWALEYDYSMAVVNVEGFPFNKPSKCPSGYSDEGIMAELSKYIDAA